MTFEEFRPLAKKYLETISDENLETLWQGFCIVAREDELDITTIPAEQFDNAAPWASVRLMMMMLSAQKQGDD